MMRKQVSMNDDEKKEHSDVAVEEMESFLKTTETKKTGSSGGGGGTAGTGTGGSGDDNVVTIRNRFGALRWFCRRHKTEFLVVLAVTLLGILLSSSSSLSTDSSEFSVLHNNNNKNNKNEIPLRKDKNGIIRIQCPSLRDDTGYTEDQSFDRSYESVSKEITSNKTEFLSTFRTAEFDGWGQSYRKIKKKSRAFKSKYYPKYLKDGSHIYESACGIGLNLFMTLEIVAKARKTSGLDPISVTVYGNEYVKASADKARDVVLAEGVIPGGNRIGSICAGDSTDLSHVPSRAFDVVYSGYITPRADLLDLHGGDTDWDDWTEYEDVCEAADRYTRAQKRGKNNNNNNNNNKARRYDWMGNTLWNIMVQRQKDWYGQWVSEMARIAKPGAPVIAEQVSVPFCVFQDDWGGVVKDYWYETAKANTYNWDIDPNSIEIMDDEIHPLRYHVFMLKNK